jgi:cyclophilin family peptidyl-prolyl cis-trans isomerase
MSTRRSLAWLFAAFTAALLPACGGDGSQPSVNGMAVVPAAYGRTAVWTIGGLNLDSGIVFTITSGSCDDLAELPGGTATQRQFACRPSSLGELVGQVGSTAGHWLASLSVTIAEPVVRLTLAQGTVDLLLHPAYAPVSVQNFLAYVNAGFYDNTIFHRVIENFVVQGGGYAPGTPNPTPKPPTREPIALESANGLSNVRGTLAMARTAEPDSATSQFYFNVVDNPELDYQTELDPGYAVFGTVTAGMDVIDTISTVPTRAVPAMGLFNLPVDNVVVTTARQIR